MENHEFFLKMVYICHIQPKINCYEKEKVPHSRDFFFIFPENFTNEKTRFFNTYHGLSHHSGSTQKNG